MQGCTNLKRQGYLYLHLKLQGVFIPSLQFVGGFLTPSFFLQGFHTTLNKVTVLPCVTICMLKCVCYVWIEPLCIIFNKTTEHWSTVSIFISGAVATQTQSHWDTTSNSWNTLSIVSSSSARTAAVGDAKPKLAKVRCLSVVGTCCDFFLLFFLSLAAFFALVQSVFFFFGSEERLRCSFFPHVFLEITRTLTSFP